MWQVVNSLESKQLGNTELRHFEGMPNRCNSNRPTVWQDVWQAQRCCLRVVRFTLEKTSLTLSKIKIKSMITLSSSSFRRDKSTCYTDKALKPARDPRGANGSLGCTHLQEVLCFSEAEVSTCPPPLHRNISQEIPQKKWGRGQFMLHIFFVIRTCLEDLQLYHINLIIWSRNTAESVGKYRPKDHKARPKEIPSAVSIVEAHLRKKTLEWLVGATMQWDKSTSM